jgi:NAD(P)-dependent dehydrogenase (short-subunit alcohol dehydrogenase family)
MEESKKILITGASGAIGGSAAAKLAKAGHHLFLSGRDEERLQKTVEQCRENDPGSVDSQTAELTSMAETEELVNAAKDKLNGLDAVLHCAGVGYIKSLEETSDADFVRVSNVNQRGTFLLCKYACPVMADDGGGLFLTLPGVLGKAGMKNACAYVASKFAVVGLVKSLAEEYQRKKIRFSLLYFGGVDSPFWEDLDMKVNSKFMIPVDVAADYVVSAVNAPDHLVLNEVIMQPASHQIA